MEKDIIFLIEEKMNCKVLNISVIGNGASGCVYKVQLDTAPHCIAVKTSNYPELIFDEYKKIKFISSRVDCKLPKLYFVEEVDGKGFLAMELIEGVTASAKALLFKPNKKKLAKEIVDFANKSEVPDRVKKAVNMSYEKLYEIIGDNKDDATLTHGDYWMPNFIIDTKSMSLKGVIDPFNVMWAEPEYELFTLTVGYGKNLHLYEIYKSKKKTSEHCDIKVELYALFNELLWYKTLGNVGFDYLEFRSKRLLKAISQ